MERLQVFEHNGRFAVATEESHIHCYPFHSREEAERYIFVCELLSGNAEQAA